MARTSDRLGMLGSVPLFEGLTARERRTILKVSKEVRHRAGRDIVKQGSTGVAFHLILDGSAKVTVRGRTRRRLGPGDYFGDISLIDGGPRSATVTAESDVTTMAITSWEFRSLLDANPSISRKLLLELCRRLRSLESTPTA